MGAFLKAALGKKISLKFPMKEQLAQKYEYF